MTWKVSESRTRSGAWNTARERQGLLLLCGRDEGNRGGVVCAVQRYVRTYTSNHGAAAEDIAETQRYDSV